MKTYNFYDTGKNLECILFEVPYEFAEQWLVQKQIPYSRCLVVDSDSDGGLKSRLFETQNQIIHA